MNSLLIEIQQWFRISEENFIQLLEPDWLYLCFGLLIFLLLRSLLLTLANVAIIDDLTELSRSSLHRFRHPLIKRFLSNSTGNIKPSRFWSWQLSLLQTLRVLILLMSIVALSQPESLKNIPLTKNNQTVRDVMFVIESSVTFTLSDYELDGKPSSRMQVVLQMLDDFISGLEGNRFGLSVFAEQAYTLFPMTSDMLAVRLTLRRLKSNLSGRTDEGMGEALGLALQQTNTGKKRKYKKIIILISDGLSDSSKIPLDSIISYAKEIQVPIYTIGVGSGSVEGNRRQFDGLIYTPLKSRILKLLAAETGGYYYHIGSGVDLKQVLQIIDSSVGNPAQTLKPRKQHIALYHFPLGLALFLWIIYSILAPILMRKQVMRG